MLNLSLFYGVLDVLLGMTRPGVSSYGDSSITATGMRTLGGLEEPLDCLLLDSLLEETNLEEIFSNK